MSSFPEDVQSSRLSNVDKELGALVEKGLSVIRTRIRDEAIAGSRFFDVHDSLKGTNSVDDSENEAPSYRPSKRKCESHRGDRNPNEHVTVEALAELREEEEGEGTPLPLSPATEAVTSGFIPLGIEPEVAGKWVVQILSKLLRCVEAPALPPNAQVSVNALLDYAWQKLNTGHWRDVPLTWRLVFTWGSVVVAGFLLRELQSSLDEEEVRVRIAPCSLAAEVVRACDRGLLMGAPVRDNPLHIVASLFNRHARLERSSSADLSSECRPVAKEDDASVLRPLQAEECPALDRFLLRYMDRGAPVKLLGSVEHWRALRTWSLPYLREKAGARTVPVELGSRYTDDNWSQSLLSLDDYLTSFVSQPAAGAPTGYLAQHQLLDQIPELRDDILVPDYCHLGEEEPRLNAWLGPKGTVSPLHHDPDHNILVQVIGYKYIRLYPEDQSDFLYPHPDPLLSNTSEADVEAPEDEWPLLRRAQFRDLILGPGEALYIPPRHWHYVRALSTSCSVSFWWR